MTSPLRSVPRALIGLAAAAVLLSCHHHSPAAPEAAPASSTSGAAHALGCGLPPGGGTGEDCPYEAGSYVDEVDHAIDQTVADHPEMVNTNRVRGCGNCYEVLDTHNFPEEVGRNLEKMGFCTKYDGEELAVKKVNAFNDQYDLLLAEGFIRRDAIGSYRSTCRPAWF